MRKVIVATALLAGFIASAQAADLPAKATYVPPPTPSNWSGMYVGGFVGYSWLDGTIQSTFQTSSLGFNAQSFTGGLYLGYDYEFANKFIFGGRVTVPLFNLTQSAAVPVGFPGVTESTRTNWATTVTMNFGYDLGQWEPYVGAGVAFASNKTTVITTFAGSSSDTELHTGLNALAGVKYAFAKNWVVGLEYNYIKFDSQNYTFFLPGIAGVQGEGRGDDNILFASLEYRF
jgi:outer membrane immunogenic protein